MRGAGERCRERLATCVAGAVQPTPTRVAQEGRLASVAYLREGEAPKPIGPRSTRSATCQRRAGRESQRTVYILAAQYETDRDLVAATVAVTTAASIVTLFVWLTAMAHLLPGGFPR